MTKATRAAVAALMLAPLALTGCGLGAPSWETVRAEANAAIDEVVASIPGDVRLDDLSSGTPLECAGEGVHYVGYVRASTSPGFHGEEFIDNLPQTLGEEWDLSTLIVDPPYPATAFVTGETLVDVYVVTDPRGRTFVEVEAYSRCGNPP
jgi:hypothetical protein